MQREGKTEVGVEEVVGQNSGETGAHGKIILNMLERRQLKEGGGGRGPVWLMVAKFPVKT